MRYYRYLIALGFACMLLFTSFIFMKMGSDAAAPPALGKTGMGANLSSFNLRFPNSIGEFEFESLERKNDFESYRLSTTRCSSEFKRLFHEIERAVAHRNKIGHVNESEIDLEWKPEGAVRAMIYNQKLYVLESKASDVFIVSRVLSTLHQIDRAVATSPEPLPNIEFSFVVSDIPDVEHHDHTIWSLTRLAIDEKMWLMPDFGYWSWPLELVGNYEKIRTEMKVNEVEWEEKVPKVLWRGTSKTNKLRGALIRVSQGKGWANIHEVKWKNRTDVVAGSAALSMVDHLATNFSYTLNGEATLAVGSTFSIVNP
ncbi:hypothetical protein BU23DRAFT_626883 [Bimuria novae-zelandiae CBS 107.79]|uniref:Glycosyl transferase CAP10 domain-containing protein n=1 Tax=Bimuria novae-zelandiae CBS 107.79 TaxID=1447943 RepID=A0A6A5UKN5_9PLEO|nr:hypothetical protein BU23DRAFT_626883 [Bimuria novae-zelandiae CBS 107.79]